MVEWTILVVLSNYLQSNIESILNEEFFVLQEIDFEDFKQGKIDNIKFRYKTVGAEEMKIFAELYQRFPKASEALKTVDL